MIAPARVTLSSVTTTALRQLSTRTGLSPNVLARFAMLLSFEQPNDPAKDSGQGELTINKSSLFGEIEPFLLAAFVARNPNTVDADVSREIAAHIARGAIFLQRRVKSVFDLAEIVLD